MTLEQHSQGAPPTLQAMRDPLVVIVGAGFGGLETAKRLGKAGVRVLLIDRQNHHLFQPLLYQVATAALSPADIAEPIRKVLRPYESVSVLYGEVNEIDTSTKTLQLRDGGSVAYDVLVIATGAGTGYFGHDTWRRHAPGLKSIADARDIRTRLLLAFELAERAEDAAERERLMQFVVVGGGPTGVEMAGSIAELSRYTLARDFRRIRSENAKITLLEAGPRLLAGFSESLSAHAARRLEKLGVTLCLNTPVTAIDRFGVTTGSGRLPAQLVIWAAGVTASGLGRQVGSKHDKAGRILVEPTLAVPGPEDVFAIGDIARLEVDGKPLPGLAQVAKQQGRHLGDGLAARIRKDTPLQPFAYRSRGNTAIVGRHSAVFEVGRAKLKGWLAWVLWAVVHVYLLVGFQHRLTVSVQWLWRYLTYERGARLIAEDAATDSAAEARSGHDQPTVVRDKAGATDRVD